MCQYKARGFLVENILTDFEFAPLRPKLLSLQATLNPASAGEHVPEVERAIRVVKERARAFVVMLPFKHVPSLMKRHLIQLVVQLLNLTVHPNGLSPYLSPSSIMLGVSFDTKVHGKLPFGTYCQVQDDINPLNSVDKPRTVDAIALRPISNVQGGWVFLNITSWKLIRRRSWKALPMPASVISLIETKAIKERALKKNPPPEFTFQHKNKTTITSFLDDDNHLLFTPSSDEGANPSSETKVSDADTVHAEADVNLDSTDGNVSDSDGNAYDDSVDADPNVVDPDPNDFNTNDDDNGDHNEYEESNTDAPPSPQSSDPEPHTSTTQIPTETNADEEASSSSLHTAESHDSNTVPIDHSNSLSQVIHESTDTSNTAHISQRDSHAKDNITPEVHDENILAHQPDEDRPGTLKYHLRNKVKPKSPVDFSSRWGIALTQMSAREGLRKFGIRAAEALIIEWKQLDDLNVFEGVHYYTLTNEQRKKALRLVQLIKEKRCGKIKGRTCADGRPQRAYIPEEEATSPTAANESILITCLQDANEERYVVTADVPGAFLHSDLSDDQLTHVVIDGALVDILIKANEKYAKFAHVTKTGQKVMYLRLKKALYGTLTAARLFWENLTGKLEKIGFKLNPYDSCVANKIINGHQCTIVWHVDDLKISHKDKKVVQDILAYLTTAFGKLSITEGNKHTYVGMDIEYPGNKTVEITMKSYLKEAIEMFPEEINDEVTTPAAPHLFEVNESCKKLPESKRKILHQIVAKLLYVSTKARPDIHIAISFLTSRVSRADEDDWKKLRRLLTYIKGTIDLPLKLSANNLAIHKWWVDAAYAVRDDGKSQSGCTMTFGHGTIMSKSNKQKGNTKSSTEAELVAAGDHASQILWTNHFLQEQGYGVKTGVLFQDNKSAILLEKNGRLSSGKGTKHVHNRYFFIKDKIHKGEIDVIWCHKDDMLADFMTKPLQGSAFTTFRDMILGLTPFDFKSIKV